jgi:hypothetical protein
MVVACMCMGWIQLMKSFLFRIFLLFSTSRHFQVELLLLLLLLLMLWMRLVFDCWWFSIVHNRINFSLLSEKEKKMKKFFISIVVLGHKWETTFYFVERNFFCIMSSENRVGHLFPTLLCEWILTLTE